jgi:hypothetical protein
MAFLSGIGASGLKKESLENIVSSLNKLSSDKLILNKINTTISLIKNAKLTSDERLRIPSDYSDNLDLTDINKAWCWINCSMRLNTVELRFFKTLVTSFKNTYESLDSLLKSGSPVTEIKDKFIEFINLRKELNSLKMRLQESYPPTGAKTINNPMPKEGKESGTPLWADPLAKIYFNIGGPKNVNTSTFIQYLQNHQDELTPDEQSIVSGTLSEFGRRRNNTAITLKNYLSKTKSALPVSFKSIFKANQYTPKTKGGRKTRRRK